MSEKKGPDKSISLADRIRSRNFKYRFKGDELASEFVILYKNRDEQGVKKLFDAYCSWYAKKQCLSIGSPQAYFESMHELEEDVVAAEDLYWDKEFADDESGEEIDIVEFYRNAVGYSWPIRSLGLEKFVACFN